MNKYAFETYIPYVIDSLSEVLKDYGPLEFMSCSREQQRLHEITKLRDNLKVDLQCRLTQIEGAEEGSIGWSAG
jgi:hypothetical protein